jgi:hypothetical protein
MQFNKFTFETETLTLLFPFGGVVPRSSAVLRSLSSCSVVLGFVKLGKSSPDLGSWQIRRLKKKVDMVVNFATDSMALGVGSLGPVTGDFPTVEGLLRQSKALSGAVAAVHRRLVLVVGNVGSRWIWL